MKSKTFSSEFRKQEFKRQAWLMGVFTGLFFLVLPVRWLMELDNLSYRTTYTWKEWCDLFIYRNVDSDLLLTSVCFAGVLCAIYHFAYLHSGKKMDFYGSFPIRRDQMFRHKVIFGYIDFVIPYTVMLGTVIILGVSKNFVTGKSMVTFLMLWGADQLIFLLVYLVSALAMILTGKIVIGILGSGVLLYFGMFADLIFNQYVRSFFETSVMEYGYGKGAYFSAFYYGNSLKNRLVELYWGQRGISVNGILFVLCGVAAVTGLFFLNRWLICRRDAEAAGKSMAFSIPARVIHIVLSVSGALWIGLIIKDMVYGRQTFWVLISVFFGAVFLYVLIQFIYVMDFRKVLMYKWQLVLAEVLAVGIACIFCFDLFGYDSYMPQLEKTQNISVSISNYFAESWYTIGDEELDWDEYRLQTMQVEQQDALYRMIAELVADQDDPDNDFYDTIRVRYTLDSGRTVDRQYYIDYAEYTYELASLFDDDSFRQSTYPYLSELGKQIDYVWLEYAGEEHELVAKDGVTVDDFLTIYREEMKDLPGSVIVEEIPLAALRMEDRTLGNYFNMFIYPSCEKSIACLKKMGWQVEPLLVAERVKEITVEDYRREEQEDVVYVQDVIYEQKTAAEIETDDYRTTYSDAEEIAEILPVLMDANYTEIWNESQDNIYADVTVESPGGYSVIVHCKLKAGELPDILEKE